MLPAAADAQVRVEERVTVQRVLVDVRVTDRRGQPITNLSTVDFSVDLDGRRARVEWSQWIGADPPPGLPEAAEVAASPGVQPQPGRLIIFLFQKDLMPTRVEGMIRMMRDAARYVERMGPQDRAAVAVYEYRLRVWQDFTSDRDRLRRVLGGGILHDPPSIERTGDVSLSEKLDAKEAEKAYSPELALLALGNALNRIEGAKSLVLFGYGFGELRVPFGDVRASYAVQNEDYDRAQRALVSSRTTVFALDITQANHHSLETGLMAIADETGGFYASTFELPQVAMNRLDAALSGYYVLSVEKDTKGVAGTQHEIRVRVRTKGATVLARQYYVD
jgi:VWFA-related protein